MRAIGVKFEQGFSLVELMISVTLGLIVTVSMVQVYQSNNSLQTYNYALSNIQQDGRYIISALRQSFITVGMYNEFSANLDRSVDIDIEGSYIEKHPVVLEADYAADAALGSKEGTGSNPDSLVINKMATEACTGSNFDFADGSEFHVVNEYYLDGTTLRCRGHDGRYLRGLKPNGSSGQSVALLENVHNLQFLYGISQPTGGVETGAVTSWIGAERLAAFITADGKIPVVGLKVAVLIKNDDDIVIENNRSLKLLGHEKFTPNDDGLYRVFESVILFRNAWHNLTAGG